MCRVGRLQINLVTRGIDIVLLCALAALPVTTPAQQRLLVLVRTRAWFPYARVPRHHSLAQREDALRSPPLDTLPMERQPPHYMRRTSILSEPMIDCDQRLQTPASDSIDLLTTGASNQDGVCQRDAAAAAVDPDGLRSQAAQGQDQRPGERAGDELERVRRPRRVRKSGI